MRLFIFILFFCSLVFGEEFKAKYKSNYDGDTIVVNIDSLPDIFGRNIPVRLIGIDTPEIKSSNECEVRVAKEARDYLAKKLVNAKEIILKDVKRDKYFRIDAVVFVDGKNVNMDLIEKKFALKYGEKTNWCKYR